MNIKIFAQIYTFLLLARKCCGIDIDYYEGKEFETTEISTKAPSTKIERKFYRKHGGSSCTWSAKNASASPNSSVTTPMSSPSTVLNHTKETITTQDPLSIDDIFQEHDDDDYGEEHHKYLRFDPNIPNQFRISYDEKVVSLGFFDNYHTTTEKPTTSRGFLYNLQPAVHAFNTSVKPLLKDVHTWFVVDKAPCWELPILFGQVGYKVKDVFSLHRTYLTGVEYDHDVEIQPYPISGEPNEEPSKWCNVAPCFGDHILCFKEGTNDSKVCGRKFKARSPTTLSRKAIVVTINKLRNHVARGTWPNEYPYLPPAADMKQVVYDKDLETMSLRWLRQCLPGPAPCVALDSQRVIQLECTKHSNTCCLNEPVSEKCAPHLDCLVDPIIGCIHTWFWSGSTEMSSLDVKCGHVEKATFHLAQVIWAKTDKIGCAYGVKINGDVRVLCSFAPGAQFTINTDYYCGLMPMYVEPNPNVSDITDIKFLSSFLFRKFKEQPLVNLTRNESYPSTEKIPTTSAQPKLWNKYNWGIYSLLKTHPQNWVRHKLNMTKRASYNGTMGMMARLVTKFSFGEETQARCDSDDPIYQIGEPGSSCIERGRRFKNLCYQYRDPTPGYRLVAVLAPMVLFTLLLFDLFGGAVRQNYS